LTHSSGTNELDRSQYDIRRKGLKQAGVICENSPTMIPGSRIACIVPVMSLSAPLSCHLSHAGLPCFRLLEEFPFARGRAWALGRLGVPTASDRLLPTDTQETSKLSYRS
jgi:hypothetical protein